MLRVGGWDEDWSEQGTNSGEVKVGEGEEDWREGAEGSKGGGIPNGEESSTCGNSVKR